MLKIKENIGILLLYVIFFVLLFIKFPLNGSLIGDLDIWFYVWEANDYYQLLFDQAHYTQISYPIADIYKYTDYVWGLMTLYIPIRLFTANDIWIFYFIIVIILSLNAITLKLLFESLGVKTFTAILLALIFNCSNFLISNIETFSFITLFPCFLAALFLNKGLKKSSYWFMLLSAIFVFYQQSFSIYIYVFEFILFAYIIFNNKFHLKLSVFWIIAVLVFTIPFFIYHNESPSYALTEPYKSATILANEYHSLRYFVDLVRINSGNLIYPAMHDIINPWRNGARSAFFGFSSYLLFVVSLYYFFKKGCPKEIKIILVLLCLTLFIASGPMFRMLNIEVLNPIGWVNQLFPKTILFRHLFRIYIFAILFCFIVIGLFLNHQKKSKWIVIVFAILFIVENFPFKYPLSDSHQYITPPIELVNITQDLPTKSIIYFLPSCLIIDDEKELTEEMNLFKREMIYSVWENQIHHHTYNGLLAQMPDPVFENHLLTCHLNEANFKKLVSNNDIDYFILAKEFIKEKDIKTEEILNHNCTVIKSNSKFVVYDCH